MPLLFLQDWDCSFLPILCILLIMCTISRNATLAVTASDSSPLGSNPSLTSTPVSAKAQMLQRNLASNICYVRHWHQYRNITFKFEYDRRGGLWAMTSWAPGGQWARISSQNSTRQFLNIKPGARGGQMLVRQNDFSWAVTRRDRSSSMPRQYSGNCKHILYTHTQV